MNFFAELDAYIHNATQLATKFNIKEFQQGAILGRRVWPRITEDYLKEKFDQCQLRVANSRLVLMTEDEGNIPVFEHLLEQGSYI